jgi:hypothetical protein
VNVDSADGTTVVPLCFADSVFVEHPGDEGASLDVQSGGLL